MSDTNSLRTIWSPHPRQELYLRSSAYECLFGGAAGGGKSDAILFGALRYVHIKGYQALILRRSFGELKELLARAHDAFSQLPNAPTWKGDDKAFAFPGGGIIEFGYLERYEDIMRYQGRQFAYIAVDELGQIPEERYWTKLMAWNRCPVKGIRKMMRGTANPGGPGHSWLQKRFVGLCDGEGTLYVDPRSGLTRAFVKSLVTDNPTIIENDPNYMKQFALMPDVLRRQLLLGDWTAGTGKALVELNEGVHLIDPFTIPDHWMNFGAFDWGYRHPWSFGWYVSNEDGDIYKVDTVTGRLMQPWEIAAAIKESVPVEKLKYIVAGHDVFGKHVARGDTTVQMSELFQETGIHMIPANINRVAGLQVMRDYVSWRHRGPEGQDIVPRFRLFRTPGNLRCFEQLDLMVMDERKPEDTLKMNADESGEGGDDHYDETRYGLTSRPAEASSIESPPISVFSTEILRLEADRKMRGSPARDPLHVVPHNEFGEIY